MSLRSGMGATRAFARAARVRAEPPAILTCAVSGGIVTGNPHQPVTRDEVVTAAVEASRAGASIVHIHARAAEGGISTNREDWAAIAAAVREQAGDVIVNFATGGQLGTAEQEGASALGAAPDVATLNCGTMNFGSGDDVLLSPRSAIDRQAGEMLRLGILPEYECFDIGMVVTAAQLAAKRDSSPGMIHVILGMPGGAPATPATVALCAETVPPGVPWAVTAVGRHFPTMALTVALGGHVRTGLEDVIHTAPGEYAQSNAELVGRARQLCESAGRPLATPAQARELLGLTTD